MVASRRKRAIRSGSAAISGLITLIATSRARRVSRARYTSPSAPADAFEHAVVRERGARLQFRGRCGQRWIRCSARRVHGAEILLPEGPPCAISASSIRKARDTPLRGALVELRLADHHGPWRCPGIGDLSCEAFREFACPERMHAIRVNEHTPQALVPLDHHCVLFNVGHRCHRLTCRPNPAVSTNLS